MKPSVDIEIVISDIDARSAALEAEKSAALAEAAIVESALGVAMLDADTKQLTTLERRLGELRAVIARIGAALVILVYRRRDAEAELHAAAAADARKQFAQLEVAALIARTDAHNAGVAFQKALANCADIARQSELLQSHNGSLQLAAHYSSYRLPVWHGELNRLITLEGEMLAAAPMA